MNLNDVLRSENNEEKVYRVESLLTFITMFLNQLLSLTGVFLFWIFMIALLTSPAWVPALVESISIH